MFIFSRKKLTAHYNLFFQFLLYFIFLSSLRQTRSINFRKNRTLTRDISDEAFIAGGAIELREVTRERRKTFDLLYTRGIARRRESRWTYRSIDTELEALAGLNVIQRGLTNNTITLWRIFTSRLVIYIYNIYIK